MDKKFIFIIVILLALPLVYARPYGEGGFGLGDFGTGVDTSSSPGVGDGSGEGDGGGGCASDRDCGSDRYCSSGRCYYAECFEDNECNIDVGEVCFNHVCAKLFDVEIKEFDSPVKLGEFFDFVYFVKGVAEINSDVIIDLWIEGADGNIVTTGRDTIFLGGYDEKTKTSQLFLPSSVNTGVYTFHITVSYQRYTAESFRTIEITVDGEKGIAEIYFVPEGYIQYLPYAMIGLGSLILLIAIYLIIRRIGKGSKERKRRKKRRKIRRKRSKKRSKRKKRKGRRKRKR